MKVWRRNGEEGDGGLKGVDTSSSERGSETGGWGIGNLIRGRKPGPQWFRALPGCSSEYLLASPWPLPCAAVAQLPCLHAARGCELQEGRAVFVLFTTLCPMPHTMPGTHETPIKCLADYIGTKN